MAINYQGYFDANPDVYRQYQQNNYGMSPEQYAQFHYDNYGKAEGRYMPTWVNSASTSTAQATTPTAAATTSQSPTLAQQILATSDPTKWTGEGHGSAQANAEDMAQILSGIGITDLKDFGQITIQVPEYDEFGNIVQTHAQTAFGNKVTGQAVPNTYGERQTGDAFGGTYSGSGNTGYRVQFDAQGNPHFYTSEQSSSSIGELMPLIQIGLLATGAGGLLGGALNSGLGLGLGSAGSAALGGAALGGLTSAAAGGNVLQGMALGGLGGYASGSGLFGGDPSIQAAMDADIAGGMVPEFGTNAAYDAALANLMANSPGAIAQLQGIVDSQVGGLYGPDNIDVGGGWNPANVPDYSMEVTATRDLPEASYSNEGRNYPTPASTQGTGGSPANASVATAAGLPLVDTTSSGLNISPSTALNAARLAAGLLGGGAVAGALTNAGGGGSNVSPTQGVPINNQDYYNAIQHYYNAYMPNSPRNVQIPLQNWYSGMYGSGAPQAASSGASLGSLASLAALSGGLLGTPSQTTVNAAPAKNIVNSYFQQNPDVAAAYAQNSYGMTPDQFAATHYQRYGAAEQRAAPTR